MHAKLPLILALLAALFVASVTWFYQSYRTDGAARGIITEPTTILASDAGRTNILLLGIGGVGHEGSELTDSILVASYHHDTGRASILSLPRDIYLESERAKLNSIYYYAEQQTAGSGLSAAKLASSQVVGIPLHYSALIDFGGFIRAIDAVGGIKVNVERSFDDYKYPIPGKENAEPESERYEHIHFDSGVQTMDGVTALKYVRSRHALGEEGTDFARSLRQQKVIRSFIASLFSTSTVFNPERLSVLKNTLNNSLITDLTDAELTALSRLALTLDFDQTRSLSIDNLLLNPNNASPYGGAWVLIPKTSWEDIHAYVQSEL